MGVLVPSEGEAVTLRCCWQLGGNQGQRALVWKRLAWSSVTRALSRFAALSPDRCCAFKGGRIDSGLPDLKWGCIINPMHSSHRLG